MSDVLERLKEAAGSCQKQYEAWEKNASDNKSREELQESLHELRKVAARIEIEIAIHERGEQANRPIPIPAHRANRKAHKDSGGSNNILENNDNGGQQDAPRKRRAPRKKDSE